MIRSSLADVFSRKQLTFIPRWSAPFCMPAFCVMLSLSFVPVLAGNAASGAEPEYQPAAAREVFARDGLGNVLEKLAKGKTVRIGYLGGSITAAAGWRVKTLAWFAEQYPAAKLSEINAAIGGTGSDLGVFRVQRDALRHKPDLLFVEFAVNDGGASPERIWRAMEGIVRQAWTADPATDICFVYTYRVGYEKDLRDGVCPRAASAMDMLAEFYGIPSINLALPIVEMERDGKLVFQSDSTPPEGVVRFSSDGVHPLDAGHQIYSDTIAQAVVAMRDSTQAVDHADKLAKAFVADHWQNAKMVPVSESMLSGNWRRLTATDSLARSFGERMGTLWEASDPGSRLSFRFRGSTAKLYDLLGPDGGQVIVTVDGETRDKPVPRFDSYCTYHRIATLSVADGLPSEEVHTVGIEIHPDQPDRSPVAFRLKDPERELKTAKYQGRKVRVSQLLLLGDLVE